MDIKKLCSAIEDKKEELYELLCSLIHINSENYGSYGKEKECAEYIKKLCIELGLETEMYSPLDLEGYADHPDHLGGRGLENRYNVTARWKGIENEDALMLMGHSDTVRIGDIANWSISPLVGEVRDGKIWGRGACDDKYALATALFIIKLLRDTGFVPKKNILFTAYCDEEHGGSNGALATVLRYPTERIVNMDCKNFEIWHCASGGMEAKYRYHTEKNVDSAALAAKASVVVMEELEAFAKRRREELSNNKFYKGTIIPDTSFRYMHVKAGDNGADLGVGEVLFLMYTDKTKEEIMEELATLEKTISDKLRPMGIIGDGFTPHTRFFHYAYSDPDNDSIRDMQAAALEASGRTLTPCASCLSDLSVILKYGAKNAFGFGIGRDFNAYGGAHQPDEYIECEKLVEYAKIIATYVVKYLG